jgi:hypothetical protein
LTTGQAKPVRGYPGYTVTADGRVFSTHRSKTGKPKQLIPGNWRPDRKVLLCRGAYERRNVLVKSLVLATWGTLEHFKEE